MAFHVYCVQLGPSVSQVWTAFCQALGASSRLTSCYHPLSNDQPKRYNQELEAVLRCVIDNNPSMWCQQLSWVFSWLTHIHQLQSFHLLKPLCTPIPFPSQESDISVPSVQHHLHRCHRVWRQTREALLRTVEQNKRLADWHRTPALNYLVARRYGCPPGPLLSRITLGSYLLGLLVLYPS